MGSPLAQSNAKCQKGLTHSGLLSHLVLSLVALVLAHASQDTWLSSLSSRKLTMLPSHGPCTCCFLHPDMSSPPSSLSAWFRLSPFRSFFLSSLHSETSLTLLVKMALLLALSYPSCPALFVFTSHSWFYLFSYIRM